MEHDRWSDDAMYHRRRADAAIDSRMDRLGMKVDELDAKVDALSVRVAAIAAIISAITILANLIGPVIIRQVLGS